MLPEEVIIKPIVTEKSNDQVQLGKYTFKVNKKATKVDIKRACEKLCRLGKRFLYRQRS